ncbi:MAG: hypothetical protein AAB425_13825, partial [Bdellovibrionota bacterium]
MQVRKFEAPTIQEALDTIKRELGPEAIILTTRKNRKGFGLLAKSSVEITAAVSDRALGKKQFLEKRVPSKSAAELNRMPAEQQLEVLDQFSAPALERAALKKTQAKDVRAARYGESGGGTAQAPSPSPASARKPAIMGAQPSGGLMDRIFGKGGSNATVPAKSAEPARYIDIDEHELAAAPVPTPAATTRAMVAQQHAGPEAPNSGGYQNQKFAEELVRLKRVVEELKQERHAPVTGGPAVFESPALQEAYDLLVINGIERRFALELIKKVDFELGGTHSNDREQVMDRLASEILQHTLVRTPFGKSERQIVALVGPTGVGKTTTLAKIASLCLHQAGKSVALINVDH